MFILGNLTDSKFKEFGVCYVYYLFLILHSLSFVDLRIKRIAYILFSIFLCFLLATFFYCKLKMEAEIKDKIKNGKKKE